MILVFPNAAVLADAVAAEVAACLAEALKTRGRASLVATGGRSPGPVYDRLREADLDWARVNITLSDERCVAADDPHSNQRLVRERLLIGAAARAHLIPLWPKPEPGAIAALSPFDAVMLGMGEDGHIASLIPGDPDLARKLDLEGGDLLAETPAGLGSPPLARVTLTLKALGDAQAIFLLISGEAKRLVIDRALAGEGLPVRALMRPKVPLKIFWSPN